MTTVPVCLPARRHGRDPGWPETAFHWYCQGCGRWELCDDNDRCAHCRVAAPSAKRSEGDR
jgi:hypothetical protein